MNELALFAGAGGGIIGGKLLGWRCVCAVERNAYARDVLVARQNDGSLAPFPVWDDVCTFDGHPWRGVVDVVSGGFPCQDISAAGRGQGIAGERSGLWAHMARIVGEVRPRYVFVENSPLLTSRGLDRVLGDLASLGYDARWGVLGAYHVGAPHRRERLWIVAHTHRFGCREVVPPQDPEPAGHAKARPSVGSGGEAKPGMGGMVDGLAAGVDSHWWSHDPADLGVIGRTTPREDNTKVRLECLGNGQVPAVVALAWTLLNDGGW